MHEDRDETIERVRAALKPLPPTDAHAVARVLSAVHGRAPKPTPRWREWLDWMRMPSLSVAGATGLVVVALIAGYVAKGRIGAGTTSSSVAATSTATSTPAAIIPAAAVTDEERAIPMQFVLDLPDATSVSIVGDFNNWAIGEAPMQKLANGVWNITLPIKPGRHEYAFVVDGKRWMADPRAPKASNSDFGKPGSVVVVTPP